MYRFANRIGSPRLTVIQVKYMSTQVMRGVPPYVHSKMRGLFSLFTGQTGHDWSGIKADMQSAPTYAYAQG